MIDTDMPALIAKALAEIKATIDPARRTEQGDDDGRQYTYASVDDIYAAVQREMAKRGLVLEMLDGGHDRDSIVALGEKVGFWLKLIPTFTLVSFSKGEAEGEAEAAEPPAAPVIARYSNPKAVVHVVAILDGGNSVLAARTNAERTYIRNLLKLPTLGQASAEGEAEAAPAAAPSAAGIGSEASPRTKPRKPVNALQMTPEESEKTRDDYLAHLRECGTPAEVNDAFKKLGPKYGRLQPADAELVRASTRKRENELQVAA